MTEGKQTLFQDARQKVAQAYLEGGALRAALVLGHGCCLVNDPEFDQSLWDAALKAQTELSYVQERAHNARFSDEYVGNLFRSYFGKGE